MNALASSYAYISTGAFFGSEVKTGGDWDYKKVLGVSNVYSVNLGTYTAYFTGEQIGNFHYGYTGATEFSDTVLLFAAGLVQIISGTSNISNYSSYFDDPNDQAYIKSGISWYKYGNI